MSVELHDRAVRIALSLVAVVGLQACTDRPTEPVANINAPRPGSSSTRLTCVADIRARTVACSAPKNRATADAGPVILGGQGTYVQLTADSASYNSAQFKAYLRVQNLTGQTLGTLTGSDTTGVYVFLNSTPVSSDGSAVTLNLPDGSGTFTAPSQPYMRYQEILDAFGGTSRSKLWTFNVANTAQYFTFTVLVSANSPERNLPLRWDVERGLATYSNLLVYGLDRRNVFAFGIREDELTNSYTYVVDRFDGVAWRSINTDLRVNVKAAWGSSPSDLWVVGTNGSAPDATLGHYDGSRWTSSSLGPGTGTLTGVWGSGPNDVYLVGAPYCCTTDGIIRHFDGSAWSPVTSAIPGVVFTAVAGTAPNNVWAIGHNSDFLTVVAHFDGTNWTTVPMPSTGNDIGFVSLYVTTSEVWAVGNGGSAHYAGGEWQVFADPLAELSAVHGTDASNVWAVGLSLFPTVIETETVPGLSTVLRWDVGTQAWIAAAQPPSTILVSVWTSNPNDVWAIGRPLDIDTDGVPWHWDGTSWSVFGSRQGIVGIIDHGDQSLNATFGIDASNVWAVGTSGQILQGTTSGWQQVGVPETNRTWNGIWARAANDIWIVGDSGQIRHWDGTTLAASPAPSAIGNETLTGVYGFAVNDVYAVGGFNGSIIHFDGTQWTFVTSVEYGLNAIWGSSATDIWAVGQNSTIFHSSDGTTWLEQTNPSVGELFAVRGSSGGQVFAVGEFGGILCLCGEWSAQTSPTNVTLTGLYTDGPSNTMLAVGARGTILRYASGQWIPVASGLSSDIHGIWMAGPTNIFTVGAGNFIAHGKP